MGLFDFLKSKPPAPPIEKAQGTTLGSIDFAPSRGNYLLSPQFENKREEFGVYWAAYLTSPWVRKCVDLRAQAASKIYRLVPVDGGLADANEIEPIEAFLNQPNPVDSLETLAFKINRDLILFGVCFVEMQTAEADASVVRSLVTKALTPFSGVVSNIDQEIEDTVGEIVQDGLPTYLRVLPAQQMEVITDKRGNPTQYVQWTDNGERIHFSPDEVLHILHPHSQSPTYGESPMKALARVVAIDSMIDLRQLKILQNDNTIDTIFSVPESSTEEIKKFYEELMNRYRGAGSTGRFLVTTNEVKIEDISKSKDGDFLKQGEDNRDTIAMVLGVPLSMLGVVDGTAGKGSGSDQHARNFSENTIRPFAIHIENIFNRNVIARWGSVGLDYRLEFVIEDADDDADLETMWNTAINNGSLTINEVRLKRGQGPIAGGDIAYKVSGATIISLENLSDTPSPREQMEATQQQAQAHLDAAQANTKAALPEDKPPAKEATDVKKAQEQLREAIRTLKKAL